MLVSGADLIRTSGQQQARVIKLADQAVTGSAAVQSVPSSNQSNIADDAKGALLRFARFIEDEKKERRQRHETKRGNPYARLAQKLKEEAGRGQMMDIFV